jgi:TolB protein
MLLACSGDDDRARPRPEPPCGANVVDGDAPGGVLAWSDDGDEHVFVDDLDDDAPPARFGAGVRNFDPDLSPDARWVAWRQAPDAVTDAADLVVADLAGQLGISPLTSDPTEHNWSPAWSPDGTRLAFASSRDTPGVPHVWTMHGGQGGGDLELVTAGHGEYPDWSPDGSRIVFAAPGTGGRYDVFTVDAHGGDADLVAGGPDTEFFPAWSPDGERIAFHRLDGGVFVVDADGGDEARVSPGADAGDPVWAPDGRLGWHGPDGFMVTDLDACTTVRTDLDIGRFPSWVEG